MSETNKIKRNGLITFLTIIVFFISIASLGLSGYLYYIANLAPDNFKNKLNRLTENALNNEAKIQRDNLTISTLKNSIDQLHLQLADISLNKINLVNLQLNQLINSANQSLIMYHDLKNAIRLLNYAENLLVGNLQANYTQLKFALASDLSKLEQLRITDVVLLNGDLESISSQINKLPKITQLVEKKVIINPEPQSKFKLFLTNIKDKLYSLVKVSTAQRSFQLTIDADEEYLLHQNIKLDLLNAKMALLVHDNAAWQYSLNNADKILFNYYNSSEETKLVSNKIESLAKINVSDEDANIDETLKALNKLNNL